MIIKLPDSVCKAKNIDILTLHTLQVDLIDTVSKQSLGKYRLEDIIRKTK